MTITIKTEEIYNDFNYFLCFLCARRVPRRIDVGQLELQMEFCDHFDVKKKVSGVQKIRKARFWASILLFTEFERFCRLAQLNHNNLMPYVQAKVRIFSGMPQKAWPHRSLSPHLLPDVTFG